jgi:ABC-type dipeptide/oligopeptide/nickel transport system permease component
MSLHQYAILPLFSAVDRTIFFIALTEMALMVWAALTAIALLRLNLTLKPTFQHLLQQLKNTQQQTHQLSKQISTNQLLWQQYWVKVIKQLPQPLQFLAQVFQWIL